MVVTDRQTSGVEWDGHVLLLHRTEELSYLDAGSCRRIDDANRAFRAVGGHVLLVAPQPPVERTLRLMDVDALPGMHLLEGCE